MRRTLAILLIGSALLTIVGGCAPESDAAQRQAEVYVQRLAALDTRAFPQSTRIVDRHGTLLAELASDGRREWVALRNIAHDLQNAVIATEDQTFYANSGVDAGAVARAALQNAQAGSTVSGASTITMQLVRLVAFEPRERYEGTLNRKLREAHLASLVTERYTKAEILEAYLNLAYFGHNAYGVEAAAQTYFGVSARDLNMAQSTLLAGLVQAPALLDPLANPAGARERQVTVLDRMVRAGFLTSEEAALVLESPLALAPQEPAAPRRAPHFVDYVISQLPAMIGERLAARGGFTVTTTLDLALNEQLAAVAARHVTELKERHDLTDAAVVALHPASGEILALVGGVDYEEPVNGQVNLATRPRQPGSAFKPVTYATAMQSGWSAADVLWDIPTSFPPGVPNSYQPVNYDGRYRGPVRLRAALANSLNAAAVNLLADVGVEQVHGSAQQFGLALGDDPWKYGLSLTLGGAETSLLNLTAAYATLANLGQRASPSPILEISPFAGGAPLYRFQPTATSVVSPQVAWLISDILADNAARRPAFGNSSALELSRPAAVKTGTTNDFRDNLTVGYTPYLAVGVWTGNKDARPMRDVLGITGAAPIWRDSMELVFAEPELLRRLNDGQLPADGFPQPEGLTRQAVCDLDSLDVHGGCRLVEEWFVAGGPATAGYGRYRTTARGCAEAAAEGQGTMYLIPPRDPGLAAQVAAWAAKSGVRVAPAICGGAAAAAAPRLPIHP